MSKNTDSIQEFASVTQSVHLPVSKTRNLASQSKRTLVQLPNHLPEGTAGSDGTDAILFIGTRMN